MFNQSKTLLASVSLAAVLLGGLTTAVAEIRVATIDIPRLLQESGKAKAKLEQIDKKAAKARETITAKKKSLDEKESKMRNSGETDEEAQLALRKEAKDLQRFMTDTEEELKSEILTVRKEVTDVVSQAVQKFAKSKSIDLVLEKSKLQQGPVLFAQDSIDITNDVLDMME